MTKFANFKLKKYRANKKETEKDKMTVKRQRDRYVQFRKRNEADGD